jgi:hypothetical protein
VTNHQVRERKKPVREISQRKKEGVKMYTQTEASIQPVRERSKQAGEGIHTQAFFQQIQAAREGGTHRRSSR